MLLYKRITDFCMTTTNRNGASTVDIFHTTSLLGTDLS